MHQSAVDDAACHQWCRARPALTAFGWVGYQVGADGPNTRGKAGSGRFA